MGTSKLRRPMAVLGVAVTMMTNGAASLLQRDLCPTACMEAGINRSNWTVVAEIGQLEACHGSIILDFSVNVPITDTQHIRACHMWARDFEPVGGPVLDVSAIQVLPEEVIPELAWGFGAPQNGDDDSNSALASIAIDHLASFLENSPGPDNRTMLFATVPGITAGVYVGANILNPSAAHNLFGPLLNGLYNKTLGTSEAALVQTCQDRSGDFIFGLIVAATEDFGIVHETVGRWSNGSCVDTASYADVTLVDPVTISIVAPDVIIDLEGNGDQKDARGLLQPRADCRTITVQSGNGCADLVSRCGGGLKAQDFYKYNPASNLCSSLQAGQIVCCTSGTLPKPVEPKPNADGTCRTRTVDDGDLCDKLISRCGGGLTAAQFYKYNPGSNFCNVLRAGQQVCCTPGKLPDVRPKKRADGSCFPYKIQGGDWCDKVAAKHGLTVKDLEDVNKNTWGWNGCKNGFWPDNWICLSDGTPPFPAPIENAVCGPQKPGAQKPAGSTSKDWGKLNPCPLNACCNTWGQCGTTAEFCIDTNTGAPGTAKKDTYGCVSNCGMTIIQSAPPKQFIKLGYFEGWNLGRKCLNMDASQIDPSYTHIHFAFAMLDDKYNVYLEDKLTTFQFEQFKKLRGMKRIVSFGGWVFSAEYPNFPIFRRGVKADHREKLADNLVKFVMDHDLDGLDLDWEYPSAPDLPDIPAGDASEALDYLRLLGLLRRKLPSTKSLSIAAPASFWYLKQFPIKAMAELLDYIVYMTYDLHGQWDAGNRWANPGCPTGNCLRSHINRTETMNALTMITKAGVPSAKVLVGVSSYGRSFNMADPNCTGPQCKFTGTNRISHAKKGRCTDTGGYISNAEIEEIGGRTWMDTASNSRIMTDGNLWVSYMDDALKESRTAMYQRYALGGTIDWAVDLAKYHKSPPKYGAGSQAGTGSTWPEVKDSLLIEKNSGCDNYTRTGTWIEKQCDHPAIEEHTQLPADAIWRALDCESAWKDVLRSWRTCDRPDEKMFSPTIGGFLKVEQGSNCHAITLKKNNCDMTKCAHHSPPNSPASRVGACGATIWNSLVTVNSILSNYDDSLRVATQDLALKKDTFINTFAPKLEVDNTIPELILGLLQIPIGIGLSRFIGGSFMNQAFFKGKDQVKDAMDEAVSGVLGIGFDVLAKSLESDSPDRTERTFNNLLENTVKVWQNQTREIGLSLFSGKDEGLDALTLLIKNGKMAHGRTTASNNHFASSEDQVDATKRAFYAIGIPTAWAANRPAPVLVDFGKGCNIDARHYFKEGPSEYNIGWRCIKGRSYILAGAPDKHTRCTSPGGPGNYCPKSAQYVFRILPGMDDISENDNDWDITVDDLMEGAVATYRKHGNAVDPSKGTVDPRDKSNFDDYRDPKVNVRKIGFIRIPICKADEAQLNIAIGRDKYIKRNGGPGNWPCDP